MKLTILIELQCSAKFNIPLLRKSILNFLLIEFYRIRRFIIQTHLSQSHLSILKTLRIRISNHIKNQRPRHEISALKRQTKHSIPSNMQNIASTLFKEQFFSQFVSSGEFSPSVKQRTSSCNRIRTITCTNYSKCFPVSAPREEARISS